MCSFCRKRAFLEASSVDLDVVEISPPPVNRSAKSKDLKMKGVKFLILRNYVINADCYVVN